MKMLRIKYCGDRVAGVGQELLNLYKNLLCIAAIPFAVMNVRMFFTIYCIMNYLKKTLMKYIKISNNNLCYIIIIVFERNNFYIGCS
jgi:hypothetical protein